MSVSRATFSPILGPMLILLPPSEKKAATAGAAIGVYTGVLYGALNWSTLSTAAQKRGAESIVIISAKYGAIAPLDLIAPYKEKIDSAAMRDPITKKLDSMNAELIVDCRSSTYQNVWTPPASKCVEIKVFAQVDGVKKVITHMSKKTRGEVARLILLSKTVPKTPKDLFDIVNQEFVCELHQGDSGQPWILEVIAK